MLVTLTTHRQHGDPNMQYSNFHLTATVQYDTEKETAIQAAEELNAAFTIASDEEETRTSKYVKTYTERTLAAKLVQKLAAQAGVDGEELKKMISSINFQ